MNYNQKTFTSADPLMGELKEELRSWLDTGAIDDLLWPKYVNDALKMIRKSAFPVKQVAIEIKNGKGELPEDFDSVRALWACRSVLYEVPSGTSRYYQRDCRLDDISPCDTCKQQEMACDACDPCKKEYLVVHKQTQSHVFSYQFSHPLQPGNLQARNRCGEGCLNLNTTSPDTFDISCSDLLVSFNEGIVHLVYYGNGLDPEDDMQMIPEDYWVQDFIMKYIRFKMFDKIWMISNDETFNQSKLRRDVAQAEYYDAKVMAESNLKRETKQKASIRMSRVENRYNKYYNMLGFKRG